MSLAIKTAGLDDYLKGEAVIHCLIMGNPKVGKTLSASYWPKPLFALCGNEVATLARRRSQYAQIRSSDDMLTLLKTLKAECGRPKADRRWSTLVIDTLDGYQRTVMHEWVEREREEAFTGWQAWGYLDSKMQTLIERANNLDMHVVINLHVKERAEGDEDSKLLVVEPGLKGALKDQIAGEFDLIGYMGSYYEAEGGERVLKRGIRWHATPKYPMLGDRFGLLPEWTPVTFSHDDYGVIFQALMTGMEELEDHPTETVAQLETEADTRKGPVKKAELVGGPVTPVPAPTERKVHTSARPAKKAGADPAPADPQAAPATAEGDPAPLENVPVEPEQALVALQQAGLEPTVVSQTPNDETATTATPAPAEDRCADCEKDLAGENRALVDVSKIKFRRPLCGDCFAKARQAQ